MKHLVYTLLLFCLFSFEKNKSSRPNIVFIFADDLGYGDLSCFGAKDISTPNIDLIASEGIKFTEFYSAAHICSPSRAALLTGRLPQRMGITNVFFPESFTGMPEEEITIAELLKQKGYATGIVGKWHLGHMERYLPLNQGFDFYYGIPYSNDMESVHYLSGNKVDSFHVNQVYTTQTYTRKALDFIEKNKKSPFFLYVPHNMPHVPIYASPGFIGTSKRGLYGDVIQELDWSVGEIIKKLKQEGLYDNTIVVFSSDNGPWLVMEDHGGSAGPLRGGKQYTFEGGMRVPTVAMWPAKIPKNQVNNDPTSQMDWFPTFAEICGLDLPKNLVLDGENILPVLEGKSKRLGDEIYYFNGGTLQAFRKGNYKVKDAFSGYKGSAGMMAELPHDSLLIDLKKDIGSKENLFYKDKNIALELFKLKEQRFNELGNLPKPQVIRLPADKSHYEYLNKKHGRN